MDVVEQLAYSKRVRRKFLERMSEMPWDEVTKNREASWYSMKNIMLHMIDNEDWIVNWVVPGRGKEYAHRKWEEYTDIGMVEAHLEEVEGRSRETLARLTPDRLDQRVNFTLSSGQSFDMTVEECLFQCFTEQLYHMGELIALFWEQNIEPPTMQWFFNRPAKGPDRTMD